MPSVPRKNRDRFKGRVVPTRDQLSHKQSRLIRLENAIRGRSAFTNRNAAQRLVNRGRAKWVDREKTVIRFLDEAEVVLLRQVRSEMGREAEYRRELTAQRNGQDLIFRWQSSVSNGYVVMGATPVAIPKRAQLAQGASGGGKW